MGRGFDLAGVDFFESEAPLDFASPSTSAYGIIGVASKGPFGPTKIASIKELHNTFGYAYIGTDTDGTRLISQGIAAAERVLEWSTNVIFCRVNLSEDETSKFVNDEEGKLNYNIANNDSSVKSIKVTGDGTSLTVTCTYEKTTGEIATRTLASLVESETSLRAALEYEGTLENIKVPLNYFEKFDVEDGEDPYFEEFTVPSITLPSCDDLSEEIGYFENAEAVDVSVLIAPVGTFLERGKATYELKKQAYNKLNMKLAEVCGTRKDCMTCFDFPIDITWNQYLQMFESTQYTLLDNDECVTLYPAGKVKNFYTKDLYECPASSIFIRQLAYTDNKTQAWFAPAGFGDSRGVISDMVSLNDVLTKDKRRKVTKLRVNPVVNFIGLGTVLFGNTTFKLTSQYAQQSYFSYISIRRLVNYIRKQVTYISLTMVFSPNDPTTWNMWVARVEEALEKIKTNRGLNRYRVVMDRSTISDEDIRNGIAPGAIYIDPVGAIEYIPIYCTVTSEDVYFEGATETGGES